MVQFLCLSLSLIMAVQIETNHWPPQSLFLAIPLIKPQILISLLDNSNRAMVNSCCISPLQILPQLR
ncbi:5-formaminoimidazole-4-carboxamide-1-(beta)-D-ribofuranosyl 5'-monophosphate synthetase [Frankliniella fusca]|uniref:5-formaminoimidazole-4-carboxamide-1-(Beta)-D-ribofuranosyl 5'-monophosphate synthetase n=1 Tax=Frankliniella fusca TaxID=407009 RepID=A0AAE1H2M6_9NEOP|nr:5-formaminoimidazole-4-carboxamide-1-(beta)-D-ribofuranosyl 5'-monophosphate synthetase [Frankliniella fusca]